MKEKLEDTQFREYCKNCKRHVKVNRWTAQSWGICILFLLPGLLTSMYYYHGHFQVLWILPGILYVAWKLMNKDKCPICKDNNFK